MYRSAILVGLLVFPFASLSQGAEIIADGDLVGDVELTHGAYTEYSPWSATEPAKISDGTGAKYSRESSKHFYMTSAFMVTPKAGASVVRSLRVWTADDQPGADPAGVAVFGTNHAFGPFFVGSGMLQLIAETNNLNLPLARNCVEGALNGKSSAILNFENDTAYESYVVVFTGTRNPESELIQFAEAQLYTTPQAPEPDLRAVSFAGEGKGAVQLTWTSVSGFVYRVYRSSDLRTWEEVEDSSVTASEAMTSLMIDRPVDRRTFFRVGVSLE